MLVTFHIVVYKYLKRSDLRDKGFILPYSSAYTVHYVRGGMVAVPALFLVAGICLLIWVDQKTDKVMCGTLFMFLCSIFTTHSGTLTHGKVLPMFRVNLKTPSRAHQRCDSLMPYKSQFNQIDN